MNCIISARQLIEGDIPISHLSSLNKTIKKQKNPNPVTPLKSLSSKLSKLQELISKKDKNSSSDKPESPDIFQKHLKFLSEIVEHNCIEDNGTFQLCETLYELAIMKISIEVLQDSRIQKLLKIIAQVCKQSTSPIVKQLGDVVNSLRIYWKSLMKPNVIEYDERYIADKCLRRIVCSKIANVFEENNFDRVEARELAISIEKKIRKMDPTMTKRYKLCFRKMIREVKSITYMLYLQSNA